MSLTEFTEWLAREMPPGTVISNPRWWAPRIAARFATTQPSKPAGAVPLPMHAGYGVIGMEGFDASDGHKQLIGLSVGKPGAMFDGSVTKVYTADQLIAYGDAREAAGRAVAVITQIVGWVHEDQLPDGYPYEPMFPHSKVDGVRMFPVFAPIPQQPAAEGAAQCASAGNPVPRMAGATISGCVDVANQAEGAGREAVACIDERHLHLLRQGWNTGNTLKHPKDAGEGDVLLYTRPTPEADARYDDLPINDAVPAPTQILPGNLFLWNWRAMQEYGRACIAHAASASAPDAERAKGETPPFGPMLKTIAMHCDLSECGEFDGRSMADAVADAIAWFAAPPPAGQPEGAEAPPHPIQPLQFDERGVLRFKANAIVRHLLDHGGIDMNAIASMEFSREDREQFAQLIGYSHAGAGALSYMSARVWYAALETAIKAIELRLASAQRVTPEGVEALARSIYEAWRAERRCKDIPAHPWETVAPATKDLWRNIARHSRQCAASQIWLRSAKDQLERQDSAVGPQL